MGTLYENRYTFLIIYHIRHRMRNGLDKIFRENRNMLLRSNNIFRKSYPFWDNVEKYNSSWQATDDIMANKPFVLENYRPETHTLLEYVISIAFPLQQWLQGCVSVLRYTFTAFLISFVVGYSFSFILIYRHFKYTYYYVIIIITIYYYYRIIYCLKSVRPQI
jgi:hypothetical protein